GNPNEQIQDLPKVVGGNGDHINLSNTTIPNKSTKTVTTPTAKANNPAPVSSGKANVQSETPNSNIQAKPKVVGGNADYTAPPKNANTINTPSGKVDATPTNKSIDGNVNRDLKNVDVETKAKGTNNLLNNYIDDVIVNGKIDADKMNKLKNAIQNNTFSVDELAEIRKKMSDLGIAKEYDEVLIKMDFGKYLRGLIGEPPTAMINPHAHHILFKKGLGQKQQEIVREGQEILRRYGIDPIIGEENLVWAPNAVIGQHSLDALELVVNRLKAIDEMGGDFDDMVEALEDLGDIASTR
ncbi:MAG: AHH domain-containing protein, partial [Psychrobacillus sp.]